MWRELLKIVMFASWLMFLVKHLHSDNDTISWQHNISRLGFIGLVWLCVLPINYVLRCNYVKISKKFP